MKPLDKDPEILYCDNHILVAIKRAGEVTQLCDQENLEQKILLYLQKKYNKERPFLHVVHRLDKPVGGLVLFARSSKALQRLNTSMREKNIFRTYEALVENVWDLPKEGKLVHYLKKEEHKTKVFTKANRETKEAILLYSVLSQKGNTRLEIQLITGRYHQIRAQLMAVGHPIVGDKKYGSTTNNSHIALHQTKLTFTHPVTKEEMSFQSKAPF